MAVRREEVILGHHAPRTGTRLRRGELVGRDAEIAQIFDTEQLVTVFFVSLFEQPRAKRALLIVDTRCSKCQCARGVTNQVKGFSEIGDVVIAGQCTFGQQSDEIAFQDVCLVVRYGCGLDRFERTLVHEWRLLGRHGVVPRRTVLLLNAISEPVRLDSPCTTIEAADQTAWSGSVPAYEPLSQGSRHGLCSGAGLELAHGVLDVELDGSTFCAQKHGNV